MGRVGFERSRLMILPKQYTSSNIFLEFTAASLGDTSFYLGGSLSAKYIIHKTDTVVLLLRPGVPCSHCVKWWFSVCASS